MSWPWIVLFALQWVAIGALLVTVLGLNQRVMSLWSRESVSGTAPPRMPNTLPAVGGPLPPNSPLADLGSGNRIFLFVGSGCPPCRDLGTKLAVEPSETLRMLNETALFMLTDPDGQSRYTIPDVATTVVNDGSISEAVGVQATPTAIAVDFAGVIRGARIVNTFDDIGQLVDQLTAPAATAQ